VNPGRKPGFELFRQAISQRPGVFEARRERDGGQTSYYVDTTPLREVLERWPNPDPEEPYP